MSNLAVVSWKAENAYSTGKPDPGSQFLVESKLLIYFCMYYFSYLMSFVAYVCLHVWSYINLISARILFPLNFLSNCHIPYRFSNTWDYRLDLKWGKQTLQVFKHYSE